MTKLIPRLVFSDLDGSLLDHYTYSFEAALPGIQRLKDKEIPLVLTSSKTKTEIEQLRGELNNRDPFIVENGAAVFIPKALNGTAPSEARDGGDYWIHESAAPRAHWLDLIHQVGAPFAGDFQTFSQAGTKGIQTLTGLTAEGASAANTRGYSEPVAWLGNSKNKLAFVAALEDAGARVQQGGRFLSVSGHCSKGQALKWLRALYQSWWQVDDIQDLAIGDSDNDLPMLVEAKTALLIKSPVHEFPSMPSTGIILKSNATGPEGWNEGVSRWLELSTKAATAKTKSEE